MPSHLLLSDSMCYDATTGPAIKTYCDTLDFVSLILTSNGKHNGMSCDECPEDQREDYQNCSVHCSLAQTIVHSAMDTDISSSYR